jgi:hypothetical protein
MIGMQFKGIVHCGYCNEEGHNITTCKQVEVIAKDAKIKEKTGQVLTHYHRRALHEMTRRKQRKAKPTKPRSKSRCSYCRSDNHRRPSCGALKTLRGRVYQANENWRKKFVKTVNDAGVGVGALVMVPKQVLDWSAPSNEWITCMVTSYILDTLNVFNLYEGRDNFRTSAKMLLTTVDMSKEFYWTFNRVAPFGERGLTSEVWSYVAAASTKVLSPNTWEPSKDWTSEKCSEIEYVLKNTSLKDKNVSDRIELLINKWT